MSAMSILIVEDDRIISLLLAEMLRDMGHTVYSIATTEEEAVAMAARRKPDLMIVDQNLRAGTGVSAVDRITRTMLIRHIFISGLPLQPSQPAATVLLKPFSEEELACAIERVVHCSDAQAPESRNLVEPARRV